MAGHGEHVNIHRVDIDGHVARGLHRVGVEQNARFMAGLADLRDGLDGSDFVVGEHDGDKTGVLADRIFDLLRRNETGFMHIQQRHLEALFLELRERMQDRVMLKLCRDDVLLALARTDNSRRADGLIVGLAAAGGEGDLSGLRADARSDGRSCGLQALLGLLPDRVQARGVTIVLGHIRKHRFQRHAAHLGGCGVVGINFHHRIDSFRILLRVFRISHIPY